MASINDHFETARELVEGLSAKFTELKEQQNETKENN